MASATSLIDFPAKQPLCYAIRLSNYKEARPDGPELDVKLLLAIPNGFIGYYPNSLEQPNGY